MLNGQLEDVNFLLRLSIQVGIESGTEPLTTQYTNHTSERMEQRNYVTKARCQT